MRSKLIMFLLLLTPFTLSAQYFYESVGTGTSESIVAYAGWDNSDPISFNGFEATYNNGIYNEEPCTLDGSSGGSYVRIGGGGGTFTISGLNTVGQPFLKLSFANICNFAALDSVQVDMSTDNGTSWKPLPVSNIKAYAWDIATATEHLPQDDNLQIRWTIDTELGWMDIKIDDITITAEEVTDPVILIDKLELDFGEVTIETFSEPQSYTIEGYNLSSDIRVTPPKDFEISLTSQSGFSDAPLELSTQGETVNPVKVYVRFAPTELRQYSDTIFHENDTASAVHLMVSGIGRSDQPTLESTIIPDFGSQSINTYSAEKQYTLEGYNLSEPVTITPPPAFEISLEGKTNFTATNPIVLQPDAGELETTTIHVRFKPTEVKTYNGIITHVSGQASKDLPVAGSGSVKQKYLARIIDYGSDLGKGYYRDNPVTAQPDVHVDVDGDGDTSDDGVAFWKFSMEEPMNPSHIYYDSAAPGAVFYGGITAYFTKPGQRITEGLLNENHELRDDFNMMVVQSDNTMQKKAYGLWFWKKEHFLNGGDKANNSVSLDSESLIAVHISRYWSGLEGGRFVVNNQGQFYISEVVFSGHRTSHTLVPTETRWALYDPEEPYEIGFNSENATWHEMAFNHVDAVGFYLFRNELRSDNIQLKWHSVEVWASIERPPSGGYHLDMKDIPGGTFGGVIDSFYMSSTEIPYEIWSKVYHWAVSNQYCFDIPSSRGYVFDRDGDMGSMDLGDASHTAGEPVTDITWQDAVLWCNALSELEGYIPCYYADPSYTTVLKQVKGRDNPADYNNTYPIYLDPSANGYRLPVPAEWAYAASEGSGNASEDANLVLTGKNSTGIAGSLDSTAWGLFDVLGNVWEYTWDLAPGDLSYDPQTDTFRTVLGGDFLSLDPPSAGSLPYGDLPGDGSFNIGFRVMRADVGTNLPSASNTGSLPAWSFDNDAILENSAPNTPDSELVNGQLIYMSGDKTFGTPGTPEYEDDNLGFHRSDGAFVTVTPFYGSRTEISYNTWKEVYEWSLSNGYDFDRDGDMGSMDYRPGDFTHRGSEPVADVGWNDAVLWCNALSEYEGRDPVYYIDTTGEDIVLRTANQWRLRMEYRPGYNWQSTTQHMEVIADYSRDGYRLPTSAEWEIMARDTSELPDPGLFLASEWYESNSGDHTHPVGTSPVNKLGFTDLGGNVKEWIWDWLSTDYYHTHNPKGTDNPDNLFGKGLRGSCFGHENQPIVKTDKERESAARPYLGFRVVRCDVGEHPEKEIFIPEVVLDFDPDDYDPLKGQTFRNNLHRTGAYETIGVPEGPVSLKWQYETNGPVSSSPILVNGALYVGSEDGNLYAIDANNGSLIWKYNCAGAVTASPTYHDGIIYIGDHAGFFHAVYAESDAENGNTAGARKWRIRAATDPIETTASVFYGIAVTGWNGWSNENKYIGFDLETGVEKWRYRSHYSNGGHGGLAVDTFNVYAPVGDNGYMSADIATEIPDWRKTGIHGYNFSPIIDESLVVYACENFIKANNRESGEDAWSFYNGANTDKHQYSSPAVAPAVITMEDGSKDTISMVFYAQLSGNLFGLNAQTGEAIWSTEGAGPYESSPSIADSVIYIGNNNGMLYARDAGNGTIIWSWDASSAIRSTPLPGNNMIYFGCDNGSIYALTNLNMNQPPVIDQMEDVFIWSGIPEEKQLVLTGIGDGDDGTQTLSIQVTSSDTNAVKIKDIQYTQGESEALVNYWHDCWTQATITITVTDDGPGNLTTSITFNIQIDYSGTPPPNRFAPKIYPNPAKNHITLKSQQGMIENLKLCDTNGRVLSILNPKSSSVKIPTGHLKPGHYILRALIGENMYSRKIIIVEH